MTSQFLTAFAGTYTFNNGGQLEWAQVTFVSDATVGNRQIVMQLQKANGTVIASFNAGIVQAASLTRTYTFSPEMVSGSSFVGNNVNVAIPRIKVPVGYKVVFKDSAVIALATDTISTAAGLS